MARVTGRFGIGVRWALAALLACSSAAFGAWSGSAWGQTTFSGRLLPTRGALERLEMAEHWHAVIPLSANERLLRISKAEDMIFAQTSLGRLHAYDAETGRSRWSVRLADVTPEARDVGVNSEIVFVTNMSKLYGLDRRTGRPMFDQTLASQASTGPLADEKHVMLGLQNGSMVSYSIHNDRDERYVMTTPDGRTILRPALRQFWVMGTGKSVSALPILTDRVAAFGSDTGKMMVVLNQPGKPQPLFRMVTGGPIRGALGSLGTRTVLVPSTDGSLYAVDLYTGDLEWKFDTQAPLDQGTFIAQERIYLQNVNGMVYSLDLNDFHHIVDADGNDYGTYPVERLADAAAEAVRLDAEEGFRNRQVVIKPVWQRETTPGELLALTPKRIYGRDKENSLFVMNRADGRMIRTSLEVLRSVGLDVREYTLDVVNKDNDRLYLGTPSGLVVCLRDAEQIEPTPLRLPAERPFGFIEGVDDQVRDGETPPPPEPGMLGEESDF